MDRQGAAILLVDIKEDREKVAQAMAQSGLATSLLLDSTGAVSASYNVKSIPSGFFIDREGIIRDRTGGLVPEEALRAKLTALGARFLP